MKIAINILKKTLVKHFYKVNVGLFMFLFFVLFGLPYDVAGFHIALAIMIIKNPVILLIVMAIWFLYDLKCIDYITKQLKEPQQQFLYSLQNRGFKTCFFLLNYVQFLVFLPVTAYTIFIAVMAIKNNAYVCMAEVIAFNSALIFITPLLYVKILQRKFVAISVNLFKPVSFRISKNIFSIPLFYIWHKRRQMLFITKFFSLCLLLLFINIYEPDHYDIRPLLLCFLLVTLANSSIVYEIKSFENEYLQMIKNFPLSFLTRFMYLFLMYALLLLPELIFVWKGYPLHFHLKDYIQLTLFGISLLCLLHVSLLTDNIIMDTYIKIIFGIAMFLFFVILYNPGVLLSAIILLITFGLFHAYYYNFEKE